MGEGADTTQIVNVKGSQSADVALTMESQKTPVVPEGETAKGLGVSDEQFTKYFNAATKSYDWKSHAREAEFKAKQRGEETPAGDQSKKPDVALTDANAEDLTSKAGLNWDQLEEKVIADGDIAKEDYEALAKIGVPEYIVKDYISGVADRAEKHVVAVMSALGGEQSFKQIKAFAQKNYTPAALQVLEQELADPKKYKVTADLLVAKAGLPPVETGKGINGPNASTGGNSEVVPFIDQSEMVRAQRDPRYRADPAFRAEVSRRAAVSKWGMNPRAHSGGL